MSSTASGFEGLKSWREIPGPSSLPLIGQLLHFLPGGSLHGASGPRLWRALAAWGPLVRLQAPLRRDYVLVFDARAAAQILRGENWLPCRPGFPSYAYFRKYHNKSGASRGGNAGIINEQGESWKRIRSRVNPVLMQPRAVRRYEGVVDDIAHQMCDRLSSLRACDGRLPGAVPHEMCLWALESVAAVVLGRRLYCFPVPGRTPAPEEAEEAAAAAQLVRCVRMTFPTVEALDYSPSLWRVLPTPTFRRAMRLFHTLDELTKYFIQKTMAELRARREGGGGGGGSELSVLEKLLDVDEETAHLMAADSLLAGIDTTSHAVTAALYLLARHPEQQEWLRAAAGEGGANARRAARAVLLEALRLLPVMGLIVRRLGRDYALCGYRVPRGTDMLICHEFMSLMECYFEAPLEFRPQRWMHSPPPGNGAGPAGPPGADNVPEHVFAFSPFGFGVRSCVGRRIAELEAERMLCAVVRRFRVEWRGAAAPARHHSVINVVVPPTHFYLHDL